MLKVLLGLGLIGLVVGIELNTSSSVATSAQVLVKNQPSETHQLSDNKTRLAESTKDESNDDLGSQNHPFEPSDLLNMPEDGSMGNFKYYFALLFVSTLSVISIIVFKAMRYAYQYFCETIKQKIFIACFVLDYQEAELKPNTESQVAAIEARLSHWESRSGWRSHQMKTRMRFSTLIFWKTRDHRIRSDREQVWRQSLDWNSFVALLSLTILHKNSLIFKIKFIFLFCSSIIS